jgi:hypothetical protein
VATKTLRASKPGLVEVKISKLRIIRPAPASNTSESAIWPAARKAGKRPPERMEVSFNPVFTSMREAESAGASTYYGRV